MTSTFRRRPALFLPGAVALLPLVPPRHFTPMTRASSGGHFLLVNGLTTSRAHSINTFTTGVSVRHLNVMIPTGQREIGSSTGKILSRGRFVPNRSSEAGTVPKNDPRGIRAPSRETVPHITPSGGNFMPCSRNALATSEPSVESGAGKHQVAFANSESATLRCRAHLFFGPATTKSWSSNNVSASRSSAVG